ncbi:MAG: hypothetical protein A2275_10315 [Bacteroidetes bacterium RIFOXYA12_FULL_35_11]|nr:MAG: hypothetical protein A2X01_10545 [Bacteroidetes bacterium GWF2_35_48]OFY74685.1 MAG: hypothetical protein A2275_10315 [Bacteroidetes bacterium RIFOXYA12_FULL_35_11]HBX49912.1 peptidylprolyl isomerase [Bacteroidales bacterium]
MFKPVIVIIIFFIQISSTQAQPPEGKVIDQVLGIVGNKIILKSDIENQFIQYKAQGLSDDGDIKCQILEEMLFQKLLVTQADLDSLEISDKELEGELDHRINTFITQIGSEEKLEQYYNKSIREIKADFKEIIKDQLLAQKMQQKLTKDVKLTPADVQKFYRSIPTDSLPQVNGFHEIYQIVKYPAFTDEEKQLIRERLEGFRTRVQAGEKFSTLAVLYSEDPGSAKSGGELGFVGRNDLVPEFAAVAFKMKNPGDVSRVVETEYGFHIIQLIERKGERINVRHILLSPKVSTDEAVKAANLMDSVYVLLTKDTLKFEDAVQKFSEDDRSKNASGLMVNQYTGNTKFEDDHIDPKTKFVIQNLKIGEISKPFETKDDRGKQVYKIVSVKSKVKTHAANLTDDYKEIQDMAVAMEKQKTVKNWINKKIESTYLKIDESYKNCTFEYGKWNKK